MDYMDGKPLRDLWPDLWSNENILAELTGYMKQLFVLQPQHSGYIKSLNPMAPTWITGWLVTVTGQFNTEYQFHDHVVATLSPQVQDEQCCFL
jgi:hypothetical protein